MDYRIVKRHWKDDEFETREEYAIEEYYFSVIHMIFFLRFNKAWYPVYEDEFSMSEEDGYYRIPITRGTEAEAVAIVKKLKRKLPNDEIIIVDES